MGKIRYQEDSATQIYNRMFRQGCQKYLLADEVGLGKTVTAANVIVKLLEENDGSRPVRIGYICSNLALADQNIRKIEAFVREQINWVEIPHKKSNRLVLSFKNNLKHQRNQKALIVEPISPSTSIKICHDGTKEERAYVYALLVDEEIHYSGKANCFRKVCQGGCKNYDNKSVDKAYKELKKDYNEYKNLCERVFVEFLNKEHAKGISVKDSIADKCLDAMLEVVELDNRSSYELKTLYLLKRLVDKGFDIGNSQGTVETKIKEVKSKFDETQNDFDGILDSISDKYYTYIYEKICKGNDTDIQNKSNQAKFNLFNNRVYEFISLIEKGEIIAGILSTMMSDLVDGGNNYGIEKNIEYRWIKLCIDRLDKRRNEIPQELKNRMHDLSSNSIESKFYRKENLAEIVENVFIDNCVKKLFHITRKCMVLAGLKQCKADMFIADEIQNYSELLANINGDNKDDNPTEIEFVVEEIFKISKVLMLSATPFRYHTKSSFLENEDKDVDCDVEKDDTSKRNQYLKKGSDIYTEFKKIIGYLHENFDFEKWNLLCNSKENAVEIGKEKEVIDIVVEQNAQLKEANVSRIERYMSGVDRTDSDQKELTTIVWEEQGIESLMEMPELRDQIGIIGKGELNEIIDEKKFIKLMFLKDELKMYLYCENEYYALDDEAQEYIVEKHFLFNDNDACWDIYYDSEDKYVFVSGGDHYYINQLKKDLKREKIRMDYIKGTPACLSFSEKYGEIENLKDKIGKFQVRDELLESFSDLELNNPRLNGLYDKLFTEEEGHKLLFIPPIHIPKGRKLSGVFEGKEGFSKRLYFSDYNMTAKSLAGLLSYEASRRVCQDLKKNADANCVENVPICHMSDGYVDIGELLKYDYERDAIFKHSNKDNSSKINIKDLLYREDKRYWNILIDKSQVDDKVGLDDNIYKNASPYYYAKEILGIKYEGVIRDFCFAYYTLMTRTDSIRVLCAYSLAETLYESMLHYGYDGVIYSVFSEYKNVSQKDEIGFVDLIKMVSGIRSNPIKCKTITGDVIEVIKEQHLKTGYAIGHYAGDKLKDSTAATTFARKQEVFNSPFWPFNYVTTSIGQEGFDFHQYCRIVVHWSLVFDPVRFEQREGRVDRYHSYSNRLNAYELVKEKINFGSGECDWNKVYDTLKKHVDYQKLLSDSMELFPDFVVPCVRREFGINRETYYLENSYEHKMLNEVLLGVGYYRSLLGQAGADTFEEKFKEFIEGKEPEEIRKYFLDLRPTPDSDTKE